MVVSQSANPFGEAQGVRLPFGDQHSGMSWGQQCKVEIFGILDVLCKRAFLPGDSMSQSFILEYWNDDNWLVGRLKGIPGVFSQGQTLEELEENIRDAYQLMNMEAEPAPAEVKTKELVLEI